MAKQLRITGAVQGVGYRVWFQSQARALGLNGWVRNRLDGSVEAVVGGEAQAIESMIALARRGPPAAQVNGLSITDIDDSSAAQQGFTLLATQ